MPYVTIQILNTWNNRLIEWTIPIETDKQLDYLKKCIQFGINKYRLEYENGIRRESDGES